MRGAAWFTLGLGVGYFLTYQLFQEKIEMVRKEEQDAAKEYYESKMAKKTSEVNDIHKQEFNKAKIDPEDIEKLEKYNKVLEKTNYGQYSKPQKKEDPAESESPKDDSSDIYVVNYDMYSTEKPWYDTISLIFYTDGVLTNTEDDVVDIGSTVGKESLAHFGEDGMLYVINDKNGAKYEVEKYNISYADRIK